MPSNYKPIGDYIQKIKVRNSEDRYTELLGINIDKFFMPSVANVVGTNLSRYLIVEPGQFACNRMHVGRDYRIPVALSEKEKPFIVSPAYDVFEIKDPSILLPEYLMMWFRRAEFDRNAWFYTDADVRGGLAWDAFCNIELPVSSIEKQREIVREYNVVKNRIKLNEEINQKLEETAQALYKQWFVDFEFPNEDGKPYKSSGGIMVYNEELDKEIPEGWEVKPIRDVANLKYGKMLNSNLFTNTGYPVFSGYGLRGFYKDYMYEQPQILVLCRGVSGTGRVEMSPKFSYITNLSIVVEINDEKLSKGYYYYYLKNDSLRTLDSGSAQAQITTGDLGFHKTLIPSKTIQEKFEKIFNVIGNKNEILKKKIKLLSDLQAILLSKMTIVKENIISEPIEN